MYVRTRRGILLATTPRSRSLRDEHETDPRSSITKPEMSPMTVQEPFITVISTV